MLAVAEAIRGSILLQEAIGQLECVVEKGDTTKVLTALWQGVANGMVETTMWVRFPRATVRNQTGTRLTGGKRSRSVTQLFIFTPPK